MRDVLIIESPSFDDIHSRDSRGDVVARQLRLLRMGVQLQHAATMPQLSRCFVETASRPFDVLHLAMHGNQTGLYLTDGAHLPWSGLHFISAGLNGRMLVLDACESSAFKPNASIADTLNTIMPQLGAKPPRFVLTMTGAPYFADSVLAWGLFYRHLAESTGDIPSSELKSRFVFDALRRVKAASLPKICASYSNGGRYVSISPWIVEHVND